MGVVVGEDREPPLAAELGTALYHNRVNRGRHIKHTAVGITQLQERPHTHSEHINKTSR